MERVMPDFSSAKVLVVGDVMLDKYWHGDTSRVSPEAPVPVVHVGNEEYRAGGAGNVAINIAALGGNVSLLGLTGRDLAAKELAILLEDSSVNSLMQEVEGYPTITKLRVISRHQQLIRLDFENGFHKANLQKMYENYEVAVKNHDVVILSDYGKGALCESERLIDIALEAKCKVLIDPKSKSFDKYRKATIITPNLSEFEMVVGKCETEEDLVEKGMELIAKYQLDALLVTRGEQGMTLLRHGMDPENMPTHAREVFDVTGAGDTVISVLGAALSSKEDIVDATKLANIAAGIVVGKLGTATVSISELQCAMRGLTESHSKMMNEDQLLLFVENAKNNGEKIVMTNGCFDILHAGHVNYLFEASRLGDRLIIAVNDDASVKRLKGDARPINSLEQRMVVLSALQSVDWVVAFSEDTPERVINCILPDVLVKGGDYKVSEIAGSDQVLNNGGKVEILSFVDGCSTTGIINSIQNSD